ncbi:MAG: M23 family metallopeptidase [Bacteroidales bacterium]|jgi:murein DD-endopeptidase MepM/ murein hydrolase activator NlpD|nr:M23 family metallopeptidase [Bacteroidales bacterium]
MAEEVKKRDKWYHKLRNKYKLVILNDETYEEKLSFKLSRLNVFVATGTLAVLLIVITTIIIAFTPLREYIPGYTDVSLYEQLYAIEKLTDSLHNDARQKSLYLENLKLVLSGKDTTIKTPLKVDTANTYQNISGQPSEADSEFREEFESQLVYGTSDPVKLTGRNRQGNRSDISSFTFFTPLRGIVTNKFNPTAKHYGVDIVSVQNEAIKATLDGVVIFTGWTIETGYTISIQHENDLVSVYKHNSALLKDQGSFVKAGDAIAIIGSTGEYSTGPHLHFELWYNGVPVNPTDFIKF